MVRPVFMMILLPRVVVEAASTQRRAGAEGDDTRLHKPVSFGGLLLSNEELTTFSARFRAAWPDDQDDCLAIVNGSRRGMGEAGQDAFVWRNLFARATLAGERGFYVDSGSWQPRQASNTWFFDRCLGWDGVCVEPIRENWRRLKKYRSCTLAKECISSTAKTVSFNVLGPKSTTKRLGDGSPSPPPARTSSRPKVTRNISCVPISTIAKRAGRSVIDFWSLDVEGHELEVLAHDWETHGVRVHALMVEDHHQVLSVLDRLVLSRHASIKVAQMPLDTLYVSRHVARELPVDPWSSEWEEDTWEHSRKKFRKTQPGGAGVAI